MCWKNSEVGQLGSLDADRREELLAPFMVGSGC